jgi:hypothetical protein
MPAHQNVRAAERYFRDDDLTPGQFWQLCAWWQAQGADEFTVALIGTTTPDSVGWAPLEARLAPFVRPPARREHLSARSEAKFTREAELWALTPESLAALPALFPDGPFQYDISRAGWAEDLLLYRRDELVLGVISHEDWGIVRGTAPEFERLVAAGFSLRDAQG